MIVSDNLTRPTKPHPPRTTIENFPLTPMPPLTPAKRNSISVLDPPSKVLSQLVHTQSNGQASQRPSQSMVNYYSTEPMGDGHGHGHPEARDSGHLMSVRLSQSGINN